MELVNADVSRLKPENEFGAIILSEILEHVEKPDIILKSLKNQLRADGRIFVNVPIWQSCSRPYFFVSQRR